MFEKIMHGTPSGKIRLQIPPTPHIFSIKVLIEITKPNLSLR